MHSRKHQHHEPRLAEAREKLANAIGYLLARAWTRRKRVGRRRRRPEGPTTRNR